MENNNENKTLNNQESKVDFKTRILTSWKAMRPADIITIVLEVLLLCLSLTLFINFTYDLSQGIHFLGEKFFTYEVIVIVIILLGLLIDLTVLIYDVLFLDYVKRNQKKVSKVVRNGHVFIVEEKDKKPEEEKKD